MDHVPGSGRSHLDDIADQISGVLDPLARDCRGRRAESVRPLVAHAWRERFGSELSRSAVADTASALVRGRPWTDALWLDGW